MSLERQNVLNTSGGYNATNNQLGRKDFGSRASTGAVKMCIPGFQGQKAFYHDYFSANNSKKYNYEVQQTSTGYVPKTASHIA